MKERYRESMVAAAPYLQLPWEGPTESEIDTFANLSYGRTINVVGAVCRDISQMVLREFVRRRNAAILPKPTIGPAAERIIEQSRRNTFTPDEYRAIVDNIRAATRGDIS
jgi:hypothetical protein